MNNLDWKTAFVRFAEIQAATQRDQEAQEVIKKEIGQRTWYTVKQAAGYLGLNEKEFREKVVNTGEVRTTPFGQRGWKKIHHADLYNYVISRRQEGGAKKF